MSAGLEPAEATALHACRRTTALGVPEDDNWWYSDGSYHLAAVVEPKAFPRARVPRAVDAQEPFARVEQPSHLTLSPSLARRMREVMGVTRTGPGGPEGPADAFEELFSTLEYEPAATDVEALRADKGQRVTMDIPMQPSAGAERYDPNDPSSDDDAESIESGESFELRRETVVGPPPADLTYQRDAYTTQAVRGGEADGDGDDAETRVLLAEVDQHLGYLRARLRRLSGQAAPAPPGARGRLGPANPASSAGYAGTVSADAYRAAQASVAPGSPRRFKPCNHALTYRARGYSRHPTVDVVSLVNQRSLDAIQAREVISLLDMETSRVIPPERKMRLGRVPRQAGGASTALIKRNVAPPRAYGRLKDRSLPLAVRNAVVSGRTQSTIVYGEPPERVRERAFPSYRFGARPLDREVLIAEERTGQPVCSLTLDPFGPLPLHPQGPQEPLPRSQRLQHEEGLAGVRARPRSQSQPYHHRQARAPSSPRPAAAGDAQDAARYELNLAADSPQGRAQADVLRSTSEILAQLKADELHLVTLMRDAEGERTRPARPNWFELEGPDFTLEMAISANDARRGPGARARTQTYRRALGILEPGQLPAGALEGDVDASESDSARRRVEALERGLAEKYAAQYRAGLAPHEALGIGFAPSRFAEQPGTGEFNG